jgi:hypothetical protein
MPKPTKSYWNPLLSENQDRWKPVAGMEISEPGQATGNATKHSRSSRGANSRGNTESHGN